jgi:hypothetical protein
MAVDPFLVMGDRNGTAGTAGQRIQVTRWRTVPVTSGVRRSGQAAAAGELIARAAALVKPTFMNPW